MIRLLIILLLLTACANSPAASLFSAPTATPAPVDMTAEEAYYFGMFDTCVLFGRAHYEAQLPDAEIESEIERLCVEFVTEFVRAGAWEARP